MNKILKEIDLDYEWILLIREAKELGMTIEEIRLFLKEAKRFT
ncbi:anti-repressor SinI family protein [Ornithinibacillus scapharcae]|nr:anti-repressor SinI family protein [Ornithinibacillus scapharcae]